MPAGVQIGYHIFQYGASLLFIPNLRVYRRLLLRDFLFLSGRFLYFRHRDDFQQRAANIGRLVKANLGIIEVRHAVKLDFPFPPLATIFLGNSSIHCQVASG